MRKGVIMEIKPRHWIVLTSDGEFVRVPRRNMALEVGEEVEISSVRSFSSSIKKPWVAAISVGVAVMVGTFFVLPQMSPPEDGDTQGFVYLDINPSIAINLDDDENIIEVKPLNKSALRLLRNRTYKNEQVDDFVEQFLDEAKHNGYLHPKDQVVLSGYDDERTSVKALHKIEKMIDKESEEEELDLNVHTLKMPKEVKEKADQTGLSPAKYAVWRIANKEGENLDVKEMEEMPITKLAQDIKPVSDFLNKPPSEEEWKEIIADDEQTDKGEAPAQKPVTDGDKSTDFTQDPASTKTNEQQKKESTSKEEPDGSGSSTPSTDQGSDNQTSSSQDSNNTKKSNSSTVE
ncbi:anti-sigma factor domain-containing protein [Thermoactinomyces mirandus]|uniref:Anti-sigma factor domain-containing protein n=1 Tax=Thermoactinomyces mirandus TaxID=2756294 RepID=A0A7W1XS94_9BACL|nr:anti-sigma factor domain-containing protein [Thermoactinomyces mirandus]MBA4602236.1 anti-sigma factor domain-containing protein [Thermoactinomyces mirandus]